METFEEFSARWDSRCSEIKAQSFSPSQCAQLQRQFTTEIGIWNVLNGERLSATDVIRLLGDLTLALEIAYSKYRKEGSWLTRLVKGIHWPKVVLNNNEWQ